MNLRGYHPESITSSARVRGLQDLFAQVWVGLYLVLGTSRLFVRFAFRQRSADFGERTTKYKTEEMHAQAGAQGGAPSGHLKWAQWTPRRCRRRCQRWRWRQRLFYFVRRQLSTESR